MYESFAEVYDLFMDDVPYAVWADYLIGRLREQGVTDGLILDLGCGTGAMTRLLANAGYNMIGADLSADMLAIAQEKEWDDPLGILYLQQDMRAFELYGTVRAVISCCDSLNYLLKEEELAQVFSLVHNYLDPGGVFLFDMNTLHKYRKILGDNVFAQTREEGALIWENTWYEEEKINRYDVTLFLPEEPWESDALHNESFGGDHRVYRRFTETHDQRGYEASLICDLLKEAGLVPISVTEGYSDKPAGPEDERMLFMAVKPKRC